METKNYCSICNKEISDKKDVIIIEDEATEDSYFCKNCYKEASITDEDGFVTKPDSL